MSVSRLEPIRGQTEPRVVELTPAQLETGVLLGRAREADVRVLDETASRRHAILETAEGRTWLRDLESANGTTLNGEVVRERAVLFDGDVIEIGGVVMRYVATADTERETVIPPEDATVEVSMDPERADPARNLAGARAGQRLRLVCGAAAACADVAALDEIPPLLVELVREAFQPDRISVVMRAAPQQMEVAAAFPDGARPPASQTLRRRVVDEGEAVWIRDAHDIAESDGNPSLVRSRFRSTLAAPFKTVEGVLGYVAVECEAADAFDEADLEALAAVARQAGLALRNQRALSTARATAATLAQERDGQATELIGTSEALDLVREQIRKAAPADAPVLIHGETGTGKELVARHLHDQSPRREHPFVALNCAALVEGLLESELFGHEKGAFTGAVTRREGRIAQAGKGTLFLDEVGDLPGPLQAKLLRVLSERTFVRVGGRDRLEMQCRILAATNRDLRDMVDKNRFREDLYYRLAVVIIDVPPLRKRPGDVTVIAQAILERLAAKMGRRVPRVAEDARDLLEAHRWPGNVRELINVLERALVLLEGDTLTESDLPADVRSAGGPEGGKAAGEVITIREAEKRAVIAALKRTQGKKGAAAALLGISWPTLNRKIREYGIEVP